MEDETGCKPSRVALPPRGCGRLCAPGRPLELRVDGYADLAGDAEVPFARPRADGGAVPPLISLGKPDDNCHRIGHWRVSSRYPSAGITKPTGSGDPSVLPL
eukprot:scaffold305814_cov30-Tisochrysis_lutea.AAC.1